MVTPWPVKGNVSKSSVWQGFLIALIFFAVEALQKSEKKISLDWRRPKAYIHSSLFKKFSLNAYSIIIVDVIIAGEWRCEQKDRGKFNSTGILELTGWTIERWPKK